MQSSGRSAEFVDAALIPVSPPRLSSIGNKLRRSNLTIMLSVVKLNNFSEYQPWSAVPVFFSPTPR